MTPMPQMNSIGNLKQIEGAKSHTYTSTTEDVDSYLCVSYEPCRSDGVTGSVVVSQPFGPVSPGKVLFHGKVNYRWRIM